MRVINWDTNQATAILTPLTSNLTLFQNSTGSDSNTGGSAANPFATLQGAFAYIASNYIFNGNTVTIQCAGGQTITSGLLIQGAWTGAGALVIDLGTSTWNVAGNVLEVLLPMSGGLIVQNGTLTSSAGSAIVAINSGVVVQVGAGITFGSVTGHHILCANNALVNFNNNYTIAGGATGWHLVAEQNATISYGGSIAGTTIVPGAGTINFANGFAIAQLNGFINVANSNSFPVSSGTVTGTRYLAQYNGGINTGGGGANFFPGNAAGSPTPPMTPGVYVNFGGYYV